MHLEPNSYEAIVRHPNGRREQMHFDRPRKVGEKIGDAVVETLVCEGCWANPCICKPDDYPCDPE